MSEPSTSIEYPDNVEDWVLRLEELMEEMDEDTIPEAYRGNAAAKATVEAWVLELQAALLFIASLGALGYVVQEIMLEMINTVIDTLQAILLALGILLLLGKLRAKDERSKDVVRVDISESDARKSLGDRIKPVPSRRDDAEPNPEWDAEFIKLRLQWTNYFILTMLRAAQLREEEGVDGETELVWRCRKDGQTCSICLAMDGEGSENGDFLPVLMRKFPDYRAYGPFMLWPHAHPRCRCWAEVV